MKTKKRKYKLPVLEKGIPDGYVYFIHASLGNTVKIGYSTDPEDRLSHLQSAHARELKLLGVLEGNRKMEKQLHRAFRGYRIRGEHFRMTGAVLAFINQEVVEKPIAERNSTKLRYVPLIT